MVDVHLWVMVCKIGMGYGIWESLAHLAGNRLSGHKKVWVTGVYGLSQVWIKTEVTVFMLSRRGWRGLKEAGKIGFGKDLRCILTCFNLWVCW